MPVTRWSLIIAAQDPASREEALGELCSLYWYPLYAYARDRGCDHHKAEDRVQSFIEDLLTRGTLDRVHPERGSFRGFLRRCFRNHLINGIRGERTEKAGGKVRLLSLDTTYSEDRYEVDAIDDQSPDRAFDGRWVMQLIERARQRLEAEFAAQGKAAEFVALAPCLAPRSGENYEHLQETTGKSSTALRSRISRMRRRFRQLVREEIVGTVADENDLEAELAHLREILSELTVPEVRELDALF